MTVYNPRGTTPQETALYRQHDKTLQVLLSKDGPKWFTAYDHAKQGRGVEFGGEEGNALRVDLRAFGPWRYVRLQLGENNSLQLSKVMVYGVP